MNTVANGRLSEPHHLQLTAADLRGQVLSVREHLPPAGRALDPAAPLVLLTS